MNGAATIHNAIENFLLAHERYLALENLRTECSRAAEREHMHIEIMKAYLEMQYRARVVTGLQYADGMDFADLN